MEQEEREDPVLMAKKAALLAMMDASSSINGHDGDPENYVNPFVSVNGDKEELSVQNSDVPSEGQVEVKNNFSPTKLFTPEAVNHEDTSTSENDGKLHSAQQVDSENQFSKETFKADNSDKPFRETLEANSVDKSLKETFAPLLAITFEDEYQLSSDNYTKGCKWSPDGSCLLVASNDKSLRIFNLPTQVACGDIQDENWFLNESAKHVKPALTMKEADCIYDYAWYPAMHSSNAESCCFAATCRGCPVHLWDAWHGDIICSYLPYDHLDELVAAHSVAFNLGGSKLFCGFNKSIRVFQVSRPGRQFDKIDAKDQPGIISCMAFNPVLPSVFVAGSYLGSLGLYTTERNFLFCRIDGCPGGVTHIQFSSDGTKMFSGARMNNEILCWDLRNPGKMLWSFRREVKTNQRIYFDLERHSSSFLVSGSTNGIVLKWNIQDLPLHDNEEPSIIKTPFKFAAHKDCCNGVSMNPHYPVLATSSGQRHFPELQPNSDSEYSSEDDGPLYVYGKSKYENSVKLWYLG